MTKVIIATDGGCRGNQTDNNIGAYAAILYFGQHKRIVTDGIYNTTNNQMELRAVIEGLKAMKRFDIPVEVHSDSAYVVNSVNKGWYRNWKSNGWVKNDGNIVKNYELWSDLSDQIDKFDDIVFVKVKGHSDNEINNEADFIVNESMDKLNPQN